MFTTVAFANAAQGINAALTALASVSDASLRQNGSGYIVPMLSRIPMIFAFGPTMTRAQISSTTLSQLAKQEVEPVNNTFPGSGAATSYGHYFGDPLQLSPFEELDCSITNTAADGEYVIVWLSDGPLLPAAYFGPAAGQSIATPAQGPGATPTLLTGQMFSVRATGATTLAVAGWTLCTLTMDQNLFPGHYQIIGARARSTNIVAFRFVVPGYAWRPGGIGNRSIAMPDLDEQRFGGWGIWAEFDSIQLPAIECLAQVADTSEIFLLDLVRTGPIASTPPGQER